METSGHTTFATPLAGAIGGDDDASYRTISVLSLVSLVLGLTAPLCFVAPLLYVIPIAGVAVAILAIGRIAASDGALIGRKAAIIGLALCVASACAAFSRTAFTQQLLSRQAREVALEWFALVQSGDVQRAFELTVASTQGPPPPPPPGSPESAAQPAPPPIDAFRQHPVVQFLLTRGQGATVRYVQDTAFDPGVRGDSRIQQQFAVGSSATAPGQSATTVELILQRSRTDRTAPARWLVSDYKSDELSPSAQGD